MSGAPDRVAGTPVEPALDDARGRTLLLSDLHVPVDGGPVLETLCAVLDDARRDASDTRVLVLGDLFEFFVSDGQMRIGAWAELVAALRDATDAGVAVTVLHGNRDFMLGAGFARRTGCRVVPGGLRFRLGRHSCLALHGDELCLRDVPYQRSKVVLRHPITRAVLRALPTWAATWVGRRARRQSRRASEPDPSRFAPVASAVRQAFEGGVDRLVFGHVHRAGHGALGAEPLAYWVLPAFDAEGVLLEAAGDELWYRDAAGRRLPDYPPWRFVD